MASNSKSYVVIAPLVISKKEDGSDLYLYENSQVPDFVSADEIKRLSDMGFIVEVSAAEAAASAPTAESN